MFTIFVHFIIFAHTIVGQLTIPISIDWRDILYADAILYNAAGYRRNISLTVTIANGGMRLNGPPIENPLVAVNIISSGSRGHYISEDFAFYEEDSSGVSQLPIGQFSEFVRDHGDVAVVKSYDNRNGTLHFRVTRDQFERRFCTPGSLFVVLAPYNNFGITVHFGYEVYRYEYSDFMLVLMPAPVRPGALMTIPADLFVRIRNHIQMNGAIWLGDNMFTNCGPSVLVGLDGLRLEFYHPSGPTRTGTLILTPEDFFGFNHETHECVLKLISFEESQAILINMFSIRGVNTRVTRDTIEICDTAL